MNTTYALVLTFNRCEKVAASGTLATVCAALACLDHSGDWNTWYVTRNGQRIRFDS